MAVALLDVNVLLALALPNHIHHQAAHQWFVVNQELGWATCPLTQLGFMRLCMQPAVVKLPMLQSDVMALLKQITAHEQHQFWGMDHGVGGMDESILGRVFGHHQLTDAYLLDLSIRMGGRFATLDRRVVSLLGAEPSRQEALALIPV